MHKIAAHREILPTVHYFIAILQQQMLGTLQCNACRHTHIPHEGVLGQQSCFVGVGPSVSVCFSKLERSSPPIGSTRDWKQLLAPAPPHLSQAGVEERGMYVCTYVCVSLCSCVWGVCMYVGNVCVCVHMCVHVHVSGCLCPYYVPTDMYLCMVTQVQGNSPQTHCGPFRPSSGTIGPNDRSSANSLQHSLC